jgi:flagellar basal body rod protein FlgG
VSEVVHLIAITRAYESVANLITQIENLSESAVQSLGKAA